MTITVQEIVDVALREFKAAPHNGSREGDRRRQLHVDFMTLTEDMDTMSLEEYNERNVKPAIQVLANSIPEDVIFLKLELPQGIVLAAESEYLRFVTDKTFVPVAFDEITGEPIQYDWVTIARFDVLFELA